MASKKIKERDVLVDAVRVLEKSAVAHSEWADRFLTFDREYTHLCEHISEEMVKARNLLKMLLTRRFEVGPEWLAAQDSSGEDFYRSNDHFFVVGREMARTIVSAAVQTVTDAARIFRRGLELTNDPEMRDLFVKLLGVSEEILCRWEEILADWEVAAAFPDIEFQELEHFGKGMGA